MLLFIKAPYIVVCHSGLKGETLHMQVAQVHCRLCSWWRWCKSIPHYTAHIQHISIIHHTIYNIYFSNCESPTQKNPSFLCCGRIKPFCISINGKHLTMYKWLWSTCWAGQCPGSVALSTETYLQQRNILVMGEILPAQLSKMYISAA